MLQHIKNNHFWYHAVKYGLTETKLCLDLDWSSTLMGAEHFSLCFVVMLP